VNTYQAMSKLKFRYFYGFTLVPKATLYDHTAYYRYQRNAINVQNEMFLMSTLFLERAAENKKEHDALFKKVLILVGLLRWNGSLILNIKCNLYPGSTADKTTVSDIIKEIRANYPIKEFVFVGDKGMLNKKNINAFSKKSNNILWQSPGPGARST
jgi:hypothetical protein